MSPLGNRKDLPGDRQVFWALVSKALRPNHHRRGANDGDGASTALNRYNAWAAIRKRAKAAGFLTPVGFLRDRSPIRLAPDLEATIGERFDLSNPEQEPELSQRAGAEIHWPFLALYPARAKICDRRS